MTVATDTYRYLSGALIAALLALLAFRAGISPVQMAMALGALAGHLINEDGLWAIPKVMLLGYLLAVVLRLVVLDPLGRSIQRFSSR